MLQYRVVIHKLSLKPSISPLFKGEAGTVMVPASPFPVYTSPSGRYIHSYYLLVANAGYVVGRSPLGPFICGGVNGHVSSRATLPVHLEDIGVSITGGGKGQVVATTVPGWARVDAFVICDAVFLAISCIVTIDIQ